MRLTGRNIIIVWPVTGIIVIDLFKPIGWPIYSFSLLNWWPTDWPFPIITYSLVILIDGIRTVLYRWWLLLIYYYLLFSRFIAVLTIIVMMTYHYCSPIIYQLMTPFTPPFQLCILLYYRMTILLAWRKSIGAVIIHSIGVLTIFIIVSNIQWRILLLMTLCNIYLLLASSVTIIVRIVGIVWVQRTVLFSIVYDWCWRYLILLADQYWLWLFDYLLLLWWPLMMTGGNDTHFHILLFFVFVIVVVVIVMTIVCMCGYWYDVVVTVANEAVILLASNSSNGSSGNTKAVMTNAVLTGLTWRGFSPDPHCGLIVENDRGNWRSIIEMTILRTILCIELW